MKQFSPLLLLALFSWGSLAQPASHELATLQLKALFLAIDSVEPNLDAIRDALNAGAEVDCVLGAPHEGMTPLHVALKYRQNSLGRLLLEAGADSEIPLTFENNLYTPLQYAARYFPAFVSVLGPFAQLETRSPPSHTLVPNGSALDFAANRVQSGAAWDFELFWQGACLERPGSPLLHYGSRTNLHLVNDPAFARQNPWVNVLKDGDGFDHRSLWDNNDKLQAALAHGMLKSAEKLLPYERGFSFTRMLRLYAVLQNTDTVAFILDRLPQDPCQETIAHALLNACRNGRIEPVRLLLKKSAPCTLALCWLNRHLTQLSDVQRQILDLVQPARVLWTLARDPSSLFSLWPRDIVGLVADLLAHPPASLPAPMPAAAAAAAGT